MSISYFLNLGKHLRTPGFECAHECTYFLSHYLLSFWGTIVELCMLKYKVTDVFPFTLWSPFPGFIANRSNSLRISNKGTIKNSLKAHRKLLRCLSLWLKNSPIDQSGTSSLVSLRRIPTRFINNHVISLEKSSTFKKIPRLILFVSTV